jgi:hypothetical protein
MTGVSREETLRSIRKWIKAQFFNYLRATRLLLIFDGGLLA